MSESEVDPQVTDALSELVRLRYGRYLNEDQMAEVRTGLEAVAKVSEELRAVKLENGDEPFFVFKPYRGGS
jgi:hypothetical protein